MTSAHQLSAPPPAETRVRDALRSHWAFVGRLLRHWGVRQDLDDAIQQVFITLATKIDAVELGKERAFLASCAVHVAARCRRAQARDASRQNELPESPGTTEATPEREVEHRQLLARLDEALAAMPDDLRTVFVLYEIEELTMQEIARALDIPAGTVASRLRRARASFKEKVGRG